MLQAQVADQAFANRVGGRLRVDHHASQERCVIRDFGGCIRCGWNGQGPQLDVLLAEFRGIPQQLFQPHGYRGIQIGE